MDTDRAESKPAPIPPSGPEPPRTSRPRRGSALAWLLFLPLGAALAWLWPDNITLTQPSAEQTPPASVSVRLLLNITQDKNRVLITWDGDAALLQRATGGTLQLTDGTHHETISLNPSRLRAGSVSYQPLTPDLEVRLIVRRPGLPPHQEWTRLIVPASPGTEANAELERLRQRTEELEARLSAQANSTPPPSTPKPRETVESARAAARQVAQETLRDRQPAPVAAAPTLPDLPPWSPAPPPLREPTVSPLPNRPPAPAPAAAPYKGPRSGRLVWTGFLPAHGSVTLQPQRATSGSLTGRLPGVPIRIRAFPAELSRNGLTVYSPAATGGTFLEGPSARNGWNRTMFRWDPKRAHDVIVIEPPSSGNEWSRLVLRASDRDVSVVVVEWDVVE